MPGVNCSISGCPVSRRHKYNGISIFKVPSSDGDFETAWRNKLVEIVAKGRVMNEKFKELMSNRRIYICQKHFTDDQYVVHDSKKTLMPGALPECNLPYSPPSKSEPWPSTLKFISPINNQPTADLDTDSAPESANKEIPTSALSPQSVSPPSTSTTAWLSMSKSMSATSVSSSSTITQPSTLTTTLSTSSTNAPSHGTLYHKTFDEFRNYVESLELPSSWETLCRSDTIVFKYYDDIHSVPKYEIYTDDKLCFKIRYFLWSLPDNHEIYTHYTSSFQRIGVLSLINLLDNYGVCGGICKEAVAANLIQNNVAASFVQHIVPKSFSVDANISTFPLFQSRFNRDPSCTIFLIIGNKCKQCRKAESKEMNILKKKETKLLTPAKLHAPITKTDPERIKLTLQNYRSEIKYLKSEIAAKSPSFYDQIRCDDNNKNGFLTLPSRRTLREYTIEYDTLQLRKKKRKSEI